MTTNQNGHLLDDRGNVAVDFVWGPFPLQPNDVRRDNGGSNLNYALDNHAIAETGYNGYPLFTPNDDGAYISGVAYAVVPNVLGQLTANAVDTLTDSEFTITTAAAATNAHKTVTAISRTAASHNLTFTASGAGAAYAVGTQVVVSGFSNTDAFLNGTYTVTAKATNTFTVYTSATDAVSLTGKSGAVIGLAGSIKTQSIAAGAGSIAVGAAITITPWAAGS
ncbi:hypothetical protein UFOVP221_73 [uncultured Caudovirales phage]|uniref:Uncharacterized protein n=1 Tax=uncultured Caudovirales phage TaxID=2100421 RepID=A0A6J7WNS8_9CAUD|nr:hypothetical protein UFOVP221_73 [uncultured Caudovirales phage]